VTNRTAVAVSFCLKSATPTVLEPREFRIDAGDCVPIPLAEPARMIFRSADQPKEYLTVPGGLYYVGKRPDGQVDVGQIALSASDGSEFGTPGAVVITANRPVEDSSPSIVTIPIKILFDDAESLPRPIWEARMRKRFDAASRLFKKYCFVEFQIVAVDSWHSDAELLRFDDSFAEFERLVSPAPARVAIGFAAGQHKKVHDPHLGGTRGPLHSHLLIREHVNKNSERECLEVLVHELGHYLGAVHSPEQNTVMRTILGDRQSRAARFRVVFDPLNTMAMCLVSQELSAQPEVRFRQLPPSTRAGLREIYTDLARALPGDPAAPQYLVWLGQTQRNLKTPGRH
jgi:hypothetical protein